MECNSRRFSTSYGTEVPGYVLVNAKVRVNVLDYLQLEGGVNNIFDRDYALMEGYPEAGRNFFVNLVFGNL